MPAGEAAQIKFQAELKKLMLGSPPRRAAVKPWRRCL